MQRLARLLVAPPADDDGSRDLNHRTKSGAANSSVFSRQLHKNANISKNAGGAHRAATATIKTTTLTPECSLGTYCPYTLDDSTCFELQSHGALQKRSLIRITDRDT